MKLPFFGDDDSCTHHHYGEWERHFSDDSKIVRNRFDRTVKLERREIRRCQHNGCDKTQTRWETKAIIKGGGNKFYESLETLLEKYDTVEELKANI